MKVNLGNDILKQPLGGRLRETSHKLSHENCTGANALSAGNFRMFLQMRDKVDSNEVEGNLVPHTTRYEEMGKYTEK